MRIIVQGPKPTAPAITAQPLAGSGSVIEVFLSLASGGPAPPYLYDIEEGVSASGPWTLVASGNVFTGVPLKYQRTGLTESLTRHYRVRGRDSASPPRYGEYSAVATATTHDVTPADLTLISVGNVSGWPRNTALIVQYQLVGVSTFVSSTSTADVGTVRWRVNGGAFTTGPVTMVNGDRLDVEFTSPNTFSTLCTLQTTIGSRVFTKSITTVSDTGTIVNPWPQQASGERLHALPGINLFGSDNYGGSGRNPSTTGVDILLVNSLANTDTMTAVGGLGSGVYEGTLEGAIRFSNGNRAKQIIPLRSGMIDYVRKGITTGVGNFALWGQFAPAPGLWTRGLRITCEGSHWQIWHMPFYLGEQFPNTPPDSLPEDQEQGDPFRISGVNSQVTNALFINCEFSRGTDELLDAYNGFDRLGFIYCAFLEAVGYNSATGVHRTQFGPIFGGLSGTFVPRRLSVERCLFAHNTMRNPTSAGTPEVTTANCLWYNCGRIPGEEVTEGTGPILNNQRGQGLATQYNLLRGLIIRGPDNSSRISGVEVHVGGTDNPEFTAGSSIHIAGMLQHGWSNPASQAGFIVHNASDVLVFNAAIRTAGLPPDRLANLTDTYSIAANPAAPTQAEKQAFVDLMRQSVGLLPRLRTTSVGRVANCFNQLQARLNGSTSTTRQLVTNSSEAGGWWTIPSTLVDPLSPGAHWHAPIPTAVNRHLPLADGFFSNGASKVGYTPMEAWAIEQHYFVGGK